MSKYLDEELMQKAVQQEKERIEREFKEQLETFLSLLEERYNILQQKGKSIEQIVAGFLQLSVDISKKYKDSLENAISGIQEEKEARKKLILIQEQIDKFRGSHHFDMATPTYLKEQYASLYVRCESLQAKNANFSATVKCYEDLNKILNSFILLIAPPEMKEELTKVFEGKQRKIIIRVG